MANTSHNWTPLPPKKKKKNSINYTIMKHISKMYTLEVKILYIGASMDSYHICVPEIVFIAKIYSFSDLKEYLISFSWVKYTTSIS